MTMVLVMIGVVSAALLLGVAWGLSGWLGDRLDGLLMALAGGALMVSVVSELIAPSVERAPVWLGLGAVLAGALLFAGADYLIDEKLKASAGLGLLLAITLDGIPENTALGVALIGAAPLQAAALAGSIFLSNVPEAAGGARAMLAAGKTPTRIWALWGGAAALLALAAVLGNVLLEGVGEEPLAVIRCLAAGAVIASLATEVFPKAYQEDRHWAGVATGLGVMLAVLLGELGKAAGG